MDKFEIIGEKIDIVTEKFMYYSGLFETCDQLLKLTLNRYCAMAGREDEMTGPVDEEQEHKLERLLEIQESAIKLMFKRLADDAVKPT